MESTLEKAAVMCKAAEAIPPFSNLEFRKRQTNTWLDHTSSDPSWDWDNYDFRIKQSEILFNTTITTMPTSIDTVSDLIRYLSNYPPDMPVRVKNSCADDGDTWGEPDFNTPHYHGGNKIHGLPDEFLEIS